MMKVRKREARPLYRFIGGEKMHLVRSTLFPWVVAALFWVVAGAALSDCLKQCSVTCSQGSCSAACSAPHFCAYCHCTPSVECGCRPNNSKKASDGKVVDDQAPTGYRQPPKT